jgi:rod shape-determining protein MreC
LQVVAETPYLFGDSVGEVVASRENLREHNALLERRVLELSQVSQQFLSLRQENARLRELLGSRARLPTEVLIAELVGVVPGVSGQFTSRVLQITDVSHALPVQINRNGVRSVAGGTGRRDALELENVPVTADIRAGDLVETSGLAGRFPVGYPVGYVASVIIEDTSAYARITVRPTAFLDRSRHVLVLFAQPELEPEELSDEAGDSTDSEIPEEDA